MATKPATLIFDRDATIKALHKAEAARAKAAEALRDAEAAVRGLEAQLFEHLDVEGLKMTALKNGLGVQIEESLVGQVEDWDVLHAYIGKTKNWQLLERRLTVTGYREFRAAGKAVPGVKDFTRRKLKLIKPKAK